MLPSRFVVILTVLLIFKHIGKQFSLSLLQALYILFVLGVVAGSGSTTLNKLFGTTKYEPQQSTGTINEI